MAQITKRKDVNPKSGAKKYGNVKFADPVNKKYPIDTKEHADAAARYFGKQSNRDKYPAGERSTLAAKITSAVKKFSGKDCD